ncbi:hypothetical protein L3X38_011466 [Prunus dulcis]|uniref:DNAse I-like superfamily protein n=1 Tax=Prunus dulcis TaxID=3755 RepID=A0AAD4WHK4_PRUDU|nr:hypothetical protein L3X38_011466 [Prunus dulcis]
MMGYGGESRRALLCARSSVAVKRWLILLLHQASVGGKKILAAVENLSVQVDFPERRVRHSTFLELPVEGYAAYELNPLLSMELEAQSEQPVEAMTLMSTRLSTKHGRGLPKTILAGKMGLHGSYGDKGGDKRKQIEDISLVLPVIFSADQGRGKHRLCINGSTGQAEETSLEGSSKWEDWSQDWVVVGLCVYCMMVYLVIFTRVTSFYIHPDSDQHRHSWELLRCLSCITRASWLCWGDFNEVLSIDDKSCNKPHSKSHIEDFKRSVLDCQLLSFDFVGQPFTWTNNRKNEHNVQAHLDWSFGNLQILKTPM